MVQAQAPGKKPVVSVGDEKLPVSFQSPGSLLLIRWVITQLFEPLGLWCRDVCVCTSFFMAACICVPPQGCWDEFLSKGVQICLHIQSLFLNKQGFNSVKLIRIIFPHLQTWDSCLSELSLLLDTQPALPDLETLWWDREPGDVSAETAPTLKCITSPEINPFGKLCRVVGHNLVLLKEVVPKKIKQKKAVPKPTSLQAAGIPS